MEALILVFAFLAPLIWICLALWWVTRQATAPRARVRHLAVVLGSQIVVIGLPFVIQNWSIHAAGLSDFTGCPNGQEYCDEFYKLEGLGDRLLFHSVAAVWIGIAVWIFALSSRYRIGTQTAP